MKFKRFAYIYLGSGLDPALSRSQLQHGDFIFTAVGIHFNEKEKVVAIAKQLVADGAQLIELCGGFGPLWISKVSEALNDPRVPVGSVAYGPEARRPLLDLLS